MPLQNRVAPHSQLHAVSAHGTFMGQPRPPTQRRASDRQPVEGQAVDHLRAVLQGLSAPQTDDAEQATSSCSSSTSRPPTPPAIAPARNSGARPTGCSRRSGREPSPSSRACRPRPSTMRCTPLASTRTAASAPGPPGSLSCRTAACSSTPASACCSSAAASGTGRSRATRRCSRPSRPGRRSGC